MTMRQFKFCVDSPGLDNDLVFLSIVHDYIVEQAAISTCFYFTVTT